MADPFTDQLRSELVRVGAELERLSNRRQLVEELLGLESASPAASAQPRAQRAARRPAQPAKRSRLPRGLITGKIREFLGQQGEPAHATAILAYLEQHDAAPRSAKPMATLQSAMQRLKEMGEVENTGRNHWRLRSADASGASHASVPEAASATPPTPGSAPLISAPAPPVVTSTTRFGSRPRADR